MRTIVTIVLAAGAGGVATAVAIYAGLVIAGSLPDRAVTGEHGR